MHSSAPETELTSCAYPEDWLQGLSFRSFMCPRSSNVMLHIVDQNRSLFQMVLGCVKYWNVDTFVSHVGKYLDISVCNKLC